MADKTPGGPDPDLQEARLDITQADCEKQSKDNTTTPDPENQDNASENPPPTAEKQSAFRSLGYLDRYLAVWILLAIILGILLGNFAPDAAAALDRGRFVGVSVPIAVGLLVMMYPILCKVRFESLADVFAHRGVWKQIGFSVVTNWVVAPFLMVRSTIHPPTHSPPFLCIYFLPSIYYPVCDDDANNKNNNSRTAE